MHLHHHSTRSCYCLTGVLRSRCFPPPSWCTPFRPSLKTTKMSGTAGDPKVPQRGRDVRVQGVPGLSAGSPWQSGLGAKYPALTADASTDVVVVGAGIAGLSCALQLARAGKKVIVLESRIRGSGQTGRTTAHIMTWVDDYYKNMISMHGLETASVVADSLRTAADWIEATVREENIDCQFTRLDGILYPHEAAAEKTLEEELQAAHKVGLTDTKLVDLGGGANVGGISKALVFPRNADFHPLKYLDGLAEAVLRHGGSIYENTKAWKAEGDRVETESGRTITCAAIVLATNSPMNHNLAVHARQIPYRSYAIGLLAPRQAFHRADYWDTDQPYQYIRAEDWDDDHYLVIVGGRDHKTGTQPSEDPYIALENYVRKRWTGLGEVKLRWNGQVMEPADGLYIHGRDPLVPERNRYIITGDSGQGMTGGTIGGQIVADLILGRHNRWAAVYDPARPPPVKSLTDIAEEGLTTPKSYAEVVLPQFTLNYDLRPNSGAVVQKGVHKVALYKDQSGKDHAYSALCPHLGCLVHWNDIEKTWDCPCHGSHFDAFGVCINGPAKADLKVLDW